MKTIVKHAIYWRGGKAAPKKDHVLVLSRELGLKSSEYTNKFELLKDLITNLRSRIHKQMLPRLWKEPVPQTEASQLLFAFTDHVIYAPGERARGPPPVVGTRRFRNRNELDKFMQLGQHPTHASPCVPAQNIDWTHPMIYEEWSTHRETRSGNIPGGYREDIGRILGGYWEVV